MFTGTPETYEFSSQYRNGKYTIDYNNVLENLTKSEERNNYILHLLAGLESRNVLILSRRRAHAQYLYSSYLNIDDKCDCRLLLGGMKKEEIENAKKLISNQKYLRLFATTGAASEGFDLTTLNTIVFTTPSTSVQQEVGRILRKEHDIPCVVIDIVDECGILLGQFAKRKKFYLSQGLEIRVGKA